VVHGRRDRLVPIAERRELARLIPGAELDLMPGGHLAVLSARAVAYAERIDAFTAQADDVRPAARQRTSLTASTARLRTCHPRR
jgi:hypothetical protein